MQAILGGLTWRRSSLVVIDHILIVTGVLLGVALAYAPRDRRAAYQFAAFGLTWALIVVAVIARTAQLE